MPIRLPYDLPATQKLWNENIFVMTDRRADMQDIRPLRILVVNLMPRKVDTETQLARLLGNTPLQIDIVLLTMRSHDSKNVTQEHMRAFYRTFDQLRGEYFDGMVLTGAPIEILPFEEVDYWGELCEIMEWSKTHVYSSFHICWGAQAALYYHYGIPKRILPEKLFGVFPHRVTHAGSILFRGFDDVFLVPHSRHATVDRAAVEAVPELKILAESDQAGLYAVSTNGGRQVFIMGHSEYEAGTLAQEYWRDKAAGLPIHLPKNYFPDDDESKPPRCTWRSGANLLYSNWLNYFVYQSTPYDLREFDTSCTPPAG